MARLITDRESIMVRAGVGEDEGGGSTNLVRQDRRAVCDGDVASPGGKTRLSEVIERARTEGPQTITRHGTERAVVLSIEDYHALAAHKPDFKAYLLGGPKVDDFSIERGRDTGRAVEL
jgi:antitoxin Phd